MASQTIKYKKAAFDKITKLLPAPQKKTRHQVEAENTLSLRGVCLPVVVEQINLNKISLRARAPGDHAERDFPAGVSLGNKKYENCTLGR